MIIFSCEFGEEDEWGFYLWIKYNILKKMKTTIDLNSLNLEFYVNINNIEHEVKIHFIFIQIF